MQSKTEFIESLRYVNTPYQERFVAPTISFDVCRDYDGRDYEMVDVAVKYAMEARFRHEFWVRRGPHHQVSLAHAKAEATGALARLVYKEVRHELEAMMPDLIDAQALCPEVGERLLDRVKRLREMIAPWPPVGQLEE